MIEITGKTVVIDTQSQRTALMNGMNNIINWTAHSKMNRNVVINAKKAPGNWVSNSLNIIDDRDSIDFWVSP